MNEGFRKITSLKPVQYTGKLVKMISEKILEFLFYFIFLLDMSFFFFLI
jgi:hypothetical protein